MAKSIESLYSVPVHDMEDYCCKARSNAFLEISILEIKKED